MKTTLQRIGPVLRDLGFRGSGQTFRKASDDFVFIVNIQSSRSGDRFFVNLGAQPRFIPAECNADIGTLKEFECAMRARVGTERSWEMSASDFSALVSEVTAAQAAFFKKASSLKHEIGTASIGDVIRTFSDMMGGRTILHLARAAVSLGQAAKARELAVLGLSEVPSAATTYKQQLQDLLHSIDQ